MASVTLTTTATIPASTGITITVYEDTNSDGVSDFSAAQAIATGTNAYTLTGFAGGAAQYSFKADFTSSDPLVAAVLDSVQVEQVTGAITEATAPQRYIVNSSTAVMRAANY